jgi:hypothetical protein
MNDKNGQLGSKNYPDKVYNVQHDLKGNLRQLRQSLQMIRERWNNADVMFFLEQCPGNAAPDLTIEEFAISFLLRRHEKRYRKNCTTIT